MFLAVSLLAACAPAPSAGAGGTTVTAPSVLLVTLDTFRADRLGQGFTPTLDRLASQSLHFTEARSVAPLTLPAHVSIMTGQRPPRHGVRLNGAVLDGGGTTLAAQLRAAGYHTGAVVGAFVLDRRFGLADGFDEYDDDIARDPDAMDTLHAERPAGRVVDRAVAMLARAAATTPWLQWVHLYDAHAPYAPPPAALARASGNAYNGEIAYLDEQLARLFDAVARRPDAAGTVIVVVGDHGESLGAHDEATHGMLVFEPALRVPLVIQAPGVTAEVRHDAASVIDIVPTVLALAGRSAEAADGRNLLGTAGADVDSYAESEYPTVAAWTPVAALVRGPWKLVMADRARLFDLRTDPGESQDVAATHAATARELTAHLQGMRRVAATPGASDAATPVSAETAQRLRSLGYVVSSPSRTGTAEVDPASAIRDWSAFEAALTASRTGRLAQAVPVLARISSAHPDSPIFASTYARALAASGRTTEALTRFRTAVARWPGDWSLYHELAVVARATGAGAEALRAEDAALALSPREPSALNGKGLLLTDTGSHAEAARVFAQAVEHDPTNAGYRANLGNALRASGDLDGAAGAYRQALERVPDLADAANGLGVVLVQQGRAAEAVPWLERASRDPQFVEAQLNLGIALLHSGNLARAREQFRIVAATRGRTRERDAARALLGQMEPR